MSENKIPNRNEIAKEFTWNSESVYPSQEAWQAELKAIQASLPSLTAFQGQLSSGANTLAQALQTRDNLLRRVEIATMYAYMSMAVDLTNQESASMPGKAQGVYGQVLAAVAFIEPEILQIGAESIDRWLAQEKNLTNYQFYFENLFRKQAHVRSGEVEEVLGMLTEPFSNVQNTFSLLTDADFQIPSALDYQGNEIEVTQGSLYKILSGIDRQARRSAWENYTDTYLAHKNTLASNLETSIKQCVFTARVRRHNSTLEGSLFEHNIPVEVFHNLIETFRKHLPTWHRYFKIRQKALGLDQLQPYDMWAPLSSERPKITYEKAIDWICEGLAPMGEDYVEQVRAGCRKQRWIDVYPNQGKTAGAFSYGSYGTYPFIVMSYTDEIFSMSTLAHELGHSMHSYLTWQNQPYIYSNYSLFVAEVASNFHQAMVRAYLLDKETNPQFQISLIEEAMANFYRYFLIMPTLARFELETHLRIERGEGLNAETMMDLMADLFQEAYGETVQVDRQRVGITWATFGHLYEDYYVYQYATGISGAHALSRRILDGTPGAVANYQKFLKAGSSVYPLEALKMAGVDLTSSEPVEETFAVLADMVDRLEILLA